MKSNIFLTAPILLLLGGCLSGTLDNNVETVDVPPFGKHFHIEQISYQSNEVMDWHDQYFDAITTRRLNKIVSQRYKNIFTEELTPSDIPISVTVKQQPENLPWYGYFSFVELIYFMPSIGLIPMYIPQIDYKFDVGLSFKNKWGKNIFNASDSFITQESFWISSLPWVYLLGGGSGKMKYTGTALTSMNDKAEFIGETLADTLARSINTNRKQIMQKILLAELENRWAVLVGLESDYSFFAEDDAKEWQKWMLANDWNNERIRLLTRKRVLKNDVEGVMENFLGNAKENDMIVIIWSGDVYADKDRPSDVYLSCGDTEAGKAWTGYRVADMFLAVKENRAKKGVFILDVSNPETKLLTPSYLESLKPGDNWLIVVNESKERQRAAGSGELTKHMMHALNGKADTNSDQIVTLMELSDYLKKAVALPGLVIVPPSHRSKLMEFPLSNK